MKHLSWPTLILLLLSCGEADEPAQEAAAASELLPTHRQGDPLIDASSTRGDQAIGEPGSGRSAPGASEITTAPHSEPQPLAPAPMSDSGSEPSDETVPEKLESAEDDLSGPSCGVGLPRQCTLGRERCCIRSLATDTCIDAAEACRCDLPGCTVLEATCDGSEDCSAGQQCCGSLSVFGDAYTSFSCKPNCNFLLTERIACHQGDASCPAGTVCSNSQLLTNIQVCIDPASIQQ